METLKQFLIFSQRKAFLIFQKKETLKKYFCFWKRNFSFVSVGASKAPNNKSYISPKNVMNKFL